MKTLLFSIILLGFCSVGLQAEPLMIFGSKLELNADCDLKVTYKGGESRIVQLNLPEASNCTFIKHAETNLIHVEQVTNSYVLLVESAMDKEDRCISNYTAISVKKDGSVKASDRYKTSGTCRIDRERKVFEYFAYKIKLMD